MEGSRFRILLPFLAVAMMTTPALARVPVLPRTIQPLDRAKVATADTTLSASSWVNDLLLKAHLSLNEFDHWQGGGTNTRTWFLGANGTVRRLTRRTDWATRIILDYGEVNTEGLGVRKNLDKIFVESVLHLTNRNFLQPFLSASGQSQFARGYDYDHDPVVSVSGFADPLILTQTGGVGRVLVKDCHLRLGAALRETFTRRHPQHSDDPATPHLEKRRTEGGLESVTSLDTRLNGTVTVKSRLELFLGFEALDSVDVDWDNEVTVKAWGAVGLNYRFQLRYDEDVFAGLQARQLLGVGFNLDLL